MINVKFTLFFFLNLWPHLQHVKVPGPGTESELRLLACAAAMVIARSFNPLHLCLCSDPCHCGLNPLHHSGNSPLDSTQKDMQISKAGGEERQSSMVVLQLLLSAVCSLCLEASISQTELLCQFASRGLWQAVHQGCRNGSRRW